jgi:3',5'-cyclic AMP phosphodiesterase CpdA
VRLVAHLSDLHFGAEDPRAVEALVRDVAEVRPALVVVSGDLTQRARPRELRAARAFLDRLPSARLCVPGNHDVPLFDLARRLFAPLGRYRRLVDPDPEPIFEDEELLVIGVSTARSNVWKAGRISVEQIDRARAALRGAGARVRVLVAHHPFTPPRALPREKVVGRALRALGALQQEGLDLVLTGHLHHAHAGDVREHFEALGRSTLAAHAGTAVSRRRRGEPNAYNLLAVERDRIALEVRALEEDRFAGVEQLAYVREPGGWRKEGIERAVPDRDT